MELMGGAHHEAAARILEGMDGVYLITPPDFGKLAPQLMFEPPRPMTDVLRDRALAAAMMPPLPIATLSSII